MANYKGYFKSFDGKLYSVKLIGDTTDSDSQEILLAGVSPFTVQYSDSNTPFADSRTSTATIKIVHNDYLEDILPDRAQSTKVILYNETDKCNEWVGYLTPKLYDQGYEEEYETIELEAADCVSSLQYLDYEEMNGRGLVSLKQIIDGICTSCGLLDGYFWPLSKKHNHIDITPDLLGIYEQNFFSSDTDEPWKTNEVLESICRYLGMTVMQYKDKMYFIDYTNLRTQYSYYAKATDYGQGAPQILTAAPTLIDADTFTKNGASITFEPVYNKIVVNDNLYCNEEFIPSMFDDKYLTNRNGEFYAYEQLPKTEASVPLYPYGTKNFSQRWAEDKVKKGAGDDDYAYFHRLYDNKYWESIYGDAISGQTVELSDDIKKSTEITREYFGGTLVDLGAVKKAYYSDNTHQKIIASKLDYTRYLCISEKHNNNTSSHDSAMDALKLENHYGNHALKKVFKLKDGYKARCMVGPDSFLVINLSCLFERYRNRPYINPDWCNTESKGCIVVESGVSVRSIPYLSLTLSIGGKAWDGEKWVDSTESVPFKLPLRWDEKEWSFWNKEMKVLNNVSYDDFVNAEGYKIPLNGIDLTQEIHFEILCPFPSTVLNTGWPNYENRLFHTNSYCWIKDFEVKVCQKGQDVDKVESDIVYENIIDEDATQELSDIDFKITTYTDMTEASYSHMIWLGGEYPIMLDTITEEALSNIPQKAEENCIERYYKQYVTPTKKLSLTFDNSFTPYQSIKGCDIDNPETVFIPLGSETDYMMNQQTITYIQKKYYYGL